MTKSLVLRRFYIMLRFAIGIARLAKPTARSERLAVSDRFSHLCHERSELKNQKTKKCLGHYCRTLSLRIGFLFVCDDVQFGVVSVCLLVRNFRLF